MSSQLTPDQEARIRELVQTVYHEQASPDEAAELCRWIETSREAAWIYAQYMHLFAGLHWDKTYVRMENAPGAPSARSSNSPVLGFLGDCWRLGESFLSKSSVFSLLVAIILPAGILLMLVWDLAHRPGPAPRPPAVAIVARMHECVWDKGFSPLAVDERMDAGQQLRLDGGLIELIFADGARVIVQGPSTFETRLAEGFLHSGQLVVRVPKGAEGFAIKTPAATIVDLGTEFGVAVDDEGLAATVHVFQGSIELSSPAAEHDAPARYHLTAGRGGRVARSGRRSGITFTETALAADRFAREIPATAERPDGVVADFAGGNGNAMPDQFPGVAGAGWAGAWSVRSLPELDCDASVEEDHPLLDCGRYLRVVMQRDVFSKDARAWAGVDRRIEAKDPVDLSRRYVISFNFRIDALSPLSVKDDRLSICSRNRSQDEHATDEQGRSIGWHIVVADRSGKEDGVKEWSFHCRNAAGNGASVPSGIPVREGAVYSFRIAVDPEAAQWTPSIAVDGGPPTAFNPMYMRSSGTAEENQYWPFLHIYWLTHARNQTNAPDKLGFALDSVEIVAE